MTYYTGSLAVKDNMAIDYHEKRAKEFIESLGFTCERFSKQEMRKGKTPDFRIYQNGEFRFYCEVKSISKDQWLDDQLMVAPPGEIVGGLRDDPVFNRIAKDIYEAVNQFDAVNPNLESPNAIAFVNNKGSICDYGDLLSTVTGNFFAEGGKKEYMYGKYSNGRIKDKKWRVHMFVWLEPNGEHYFLFNDLKRNHVRNLCLWLGKDPDKI